MVVIMSVFQGRCPGPTIQWVNCNGHNCPFWGKFSDWTPCPVTCGNGVVTRARKCIGGEVRVARIKSLNKILNNFY